MPTYRATVVYPADAPPIANGYVALDGDGAIAYVGPEPPADAGDVEALAGALVPGFVNAHCHLELSHLRGRVDTGTGLLPFLRAVVSLRATDPAEIAAAIARGDAAMWADGIQAVGDISNVADTAAVKRASPIAYYTFVEAFDFLRGGARAREVFANARATYEAQPAPKRYVPHAPYTVSPELHRLLREANPPGGTVSLHNQETPAEDELFRAGTGGFVDFYAGFGFSLDEFAPAGKTSLAATLEHLDPAQRHLFVHNTLTTAEDIARAEAWGQAGVYWATCPNANLYIENRLPRYRDFLDAGARVCIGTDSLTSNWQLSVLEEMKTIQRYQRFVDTETLVRWATLHGAEALGMEAELGSLTVGKRPGLVLVEHLGEGGRLTQASSARRVA